MKRIPLVLLAMATALATAPVALANSVVYDWSFLSTTSNATRYIDGSGTLTVSGSSGTRAITGITGTITDTIDGLTEPINGLQSVPGDSFTFLGGTYTYDDDLGPDNTLGTAADNGGVYFSIDGDGDTVLLTSNAVDIFFPATPDPNSAGADTRSISEESITAVPEPAPLALLGTGFLGLALLLFRRSRRPVQFLNAQ